MSTYNYTTIDPPGSTDTQPAAINDSGEVVGKYSQGSTWVGFLYNGSAYTTINPPGSQPGATTYAYAINDSGEVVGDFENGYPPVLGLLYYGGGYTTFNPPGSTLPNADALNDSGEVAGQYYNGSTWVGFLYNADGYTTINPPGSTATYVDAINNSGEIVGYYYNGTTIESGITFSTGPGFLYSGGIYTTIDPPGGTDSSASAINDSGEIVGNYEDGSSTELGFLYNDGTYTTINPPGSTDTEVTGINDSGEVVGSYYEDAGDNSISFLYNEGTYTTIDPPGATASYAVAINDKGEVVGSYINGGTPFGFIATPESLIFTTGADIVDFNNLTADQQAAIAGEADIYHGLGGSDVVTLPDEANYNESVGNGQTLGWTDTPASTFYTGSRIGDTYTVNGGDGDYYIVEGAGTEFITINGDGDSTITAGSGSDTISITGNGDNAITAGTGSAAVSINGTGDNEIDGSLTGSVTLSGGGILDLTDAFNGSAAINNGSTLQAGGSFSAATVVFGSGGGTLSAVEVDVAANGLISGSGLLDAPNIDNDGVIEATGALDVQGIVYGSGTLEIDNGATLTIDGAVTASQTITFAGNSGVLVMQQPTATTAEINNFGTGNTIDLVGLPVTDVDFNGDNGLVLFSIAPGQTVATVLGTLDLTGTYASEEFFASPDGNGGTTITLVPENIAAETGTLSSNAADQAIDGFILDFTIKEIIHELQQQGSTFAVKNFGTVLGEFYSGATNILTSLKAGLDIGTTINQLMTEYQNGQDTTVTAYKLAKQIGFALGTVLAAELELTGIQAAAVPYVTQEAAAAVFTGWNLIVSNLIEMYFSHQTSQILSNLDTLSVTSPTSNLLLQVTPGAAPITSVASLASVGALDVDVLPGATLTTVGTYDILGADTPESIGTITVDGSLSQWDNPGSVGVGINGDGTLIVSAGGGVDAAGAIGVAENAYSSGDFVVEGGGTATSAGTGDTIGGAAGADGTVTVTGQGSAWTLSSPLTIGQSGTGELNIDDGGLVSIDGPLAIGPSGSVELSAATLDAASVSLGPGASLTGSGTVSGSIINNGAIVVAAGTLAVDGSISGNGAIVVDSSGKLTISGTLSDVGSISATGPIITGGSQMASSTWTWLGATSNPFLSSNWTLSAGPGNAASLPQSGDLAIIGSAATPPDYDDAVVNAATFRLVSNGTLAFFNDTTSASTSGIGSQSVIDGYSTATTLSIAGPFTNAGTIEATGTQTSLDIVLTAGSAAAGSLINTGLIEVLQGDTLSISGGTFSDPGDVEVFGTMTVASTLVGTNYLAIDTGGTLEVNQAGAGALTTINFAGTSGLLKLDDPKSFAGNLEITSFMRGDTLDLGPANVSAVVFDGNGDIFAIGNSGTVFSAYDPSDNTALSGFGTDGTFVLSGTGGLAGDLLVTEGNGDDTVLTELAPSVWKWATGASAQFSTPADWTVLSGPGSGWGAPSQPGDSAIVAGGSIYFGNEVFQASNITIDLGGTAGVAALFVNSDAGTNAQNPSLNDTSLLTNVVPGNTTAETSLLSAAGAFVNEGTILADGPTGSSFTIAISGTTINSAFVPGYFFNSGTIQADAGNTLIINVGSASELFNTGSIVADGGTVILNYSSSAIAGGEASVRGFDVIEGGGTLETASFFPGSDGNNGTHGEYSFGDSTPGNTLKIENIGSFGGVILHFSAGDTIDLGTIMAVATLAYSTATNLLSLEAANGATLASLIVGEVGTGFANGTFAVTNGAADGISIGLGGDGDTVLTTNLTLLENSGTSGTWQSPGSWAGGVVPSTTDQVAIGFGATSPSTLTTGGTAVSVGGFSINSPLATVQINSNTTLTSDANTGQISAYAGTLDIATGATLTGGGIQLYSPATAFTLAAGATADLAGRLNLDLAPQADVWNLQPGQNPYALTVSAGTAVVDGSLLAGPTASTRGGGTAIGYESAGVSATVIVNAGGTVTDTHDTLGSDATSSGTLIIDGPGASWTDMIDNADTYDTRGNIVVGYNDVALNTPGSLAGPGDIAPALLVVENDATLTEQGQGASIANTEESAGNVTIEAGGVWNLAYNNASSGLGVGRAGPGTLSVLNGGTVLVGGTLTYLSNGATVTGGGIGVGQSAGATGTILVSGAGSWLSSDDGMSVGQAGQALLEILNGGTVVINANGIGVGQTAAAGASGTVIVGGTGAAAALDFTAAFGTLAAASGMTVGNATSGTLIVADAGTINLSGTGGITVGNNSGVMGDVVVGGTATAAVINIGTQGISVGNNGTGTLAVNSLGTIALNGTGYVTAGVNSGSMGSITVGGGPGNALVTLGTAGVTIGNSGTGYLSVADHGTIAMTGTGYLNIGSNFGSKGSVVVAGTAASALINIGGAAGVLVGNSGTGYLAVGSLGTVDVDGAGYLTIGNNGGSSGTVVVGGATASAVLNVGTAGVTVGNNGTGYLTVNSRGTINITGTEGTSLLIGGNSGAAGTMTVNGGLVTEGSTATGLVVGQNFGANGTLSIINGGTVSLAGSGLSVANSGANGAVTVQGAGSELETTGTAGINVGNGGNGTLAISASGLVNDANNLTIGENGGSSGGLVSVSGGTLEAPDITVGQYGNGTLTVANGGKVFLNSSTASAITASGQNGIVTVTGAGSLLQGQTLIVGQSSQGTLYVQNGGSVSLALLEVGSAASFGGNGTVAVTGGGEIETGALVVGRNSTLSVDGVSGIDIGTSGSFVTGAINVESGFTLAGNGLVTATVVNDGVIDSVGGQTFEITGNVSGTGSINLAPESILKLDQALPGNQAITFDTSDGETLILNSPSSVISNPITGLDNGDRIAFGNVATISNVEYSGGANGTITVFTNTGSILLTDVSFAAGATQQLFPYIDANTGDWTIQVVTPTETWNGGFGTSLGTAANWVPSSMPTPADVLTFNSSGTLTGTAQGLNANFNGGPWVMNDATLDLAGAPSPPYQPYAFNQSATSLIVNGGSLIGDGSGDVDSAAGSAITIAAGAQVSFEGFGVGDQFGDSGSLLATGAGTTLLIPYAPIPAGYGGYFNIGGNSGAIGQATITNGAAVIEAGGAAIGVSTSSQGTLTVSAGGSLQNTGMSIGTSTGGAGTVTVNGGAITANGYGIQDGGAGTGVMTVTNGTVTADGLGIGIDYNGPGTGGSGTLSIQSGGLVIDPSNGISIGQFANGTLIVSGGTLSDASYVNIADSTSADGIANVGNGGAWLNTQGLSIGSGGFGTLTVGGSIVSGGVNAGTVTADGISVGNSSTGNGLLAIGPGGSVTDSGTYTFAGNQPGTSGTITVNGAGAALNSNALIVGNSGTGFATVSNGGVVNAESLAVGQFGYGTLTVESAGKVTVTSTGTATAGVNIGNTSGSDGQLNVLAGGTVALNASYITAGGSGAGSGQPAAQGTIAVNGANALLSTTAGINLGQSGKGDLQVLNGGTVALTGTGSGIGIGEGTGSSGTLLVSGGGAMLNLGTATAGIGVGQSGAGTLDIESGGTVQLNASGVGVGENSGGSGLLLVNGPNALFAEVPTGSGMGVGEGGAGTVEVTNGGSLLTPGFGIGNGTNIHGLAVVSGSGSLLEVNSPTNGINVGSTGQGTLDVNSGGTVIPGLSLVIGNTNSTGAGGTGTVNIGAGGTILFTEAPQTNVFAVTVGGGSANNSAASGVMTVSGAGALLNTNDNPLGVGLNSSGTLDITQGGSVVAGTPNSNVYSGVSIGKTSVGTVVVSDPGSNLTAIGIVIDGRSGSGNLVIENHASMVVDDDPTGDGTIAIGDGNGGNGSVQTSITTGGTGTLSVTSDGDLYAQQGVYVGSNGASGTLTVGNGGTVEAAFQVGIGRSETLSAGGSLITNAGTTVVASAQLVTGQGTIVVDAGGLLKADGAGITAAGTADISVGAGVDAPGALTVTGAGAIVNSSGYQVAVGQFGQGSLLVSQGGTVLAGSQFASDAALLIGATTGISGTVTVTDLGSSITAAGQIDVGVSGSGTLTIENGGVVTATQLFAGVSAGGSGDVTLTGTGSALDIANSATFAGSGTDLTVASGAVLQVAGGVTLAAGAGLTLQGGTIDPLTVSLAAGSERSGGTGLIDATQAIDNAATLYADAGTLTLDAPIVQAGSLGGSGVLEIDNGGDLEINGAVDSSQTVNFAGTGTLEIGDIRQFAPTEINGFAPGDTIVVDGVGSLSQSFNSSTDQLVLTDQVDNHYTLQFAGSLVAGDFTSSVIPGSFSAVGGWANDLSGDFDDPTKWIGRAVPSGSEDAVIDFTDQPKVVHDSGDDTLNAVRNIAGDFVMSGGTVNANTLENDSAMAWTGGSLVLNSGTGGVATLLNTAGAALTISGNGQRLSATGTGTTSVNNAGTITASGGSGAANIDVALVNSGLVQVNQGTLSLNGGGSSNGYGLAGGASGTLRFGLPASGPGGDFVVSGGEYAVGNTTVDGGTLDLSAASSGIFFVDSLRLAGAGTLLLGAQNATAQNGFVQGPTTWAGATGIPFLSGSGTFTVYGGGSLIDGVESGAGLTRLIGTNQLGAIDLDGGRTVENDGWMTWSSGNIALGTGDASAATQSGTIANASGATYYITADARIGNAGAGTSALDNAGVTAVFAGIGETDIDAYVANSGYIQAQSGTLSLNGGGSSAGGNLFVAGNAVLQFGTMASGAAGPAFAITSGQYAVGDTAITGGTLDVSAASGAVFVSLLEITGGTLQLGALSDGVAQGALAQSGGLLTGSGLFTVYGGGSLTGGVQSGPAITRLYGTNVLGGSFALDGGRTVENDGWMNWSSGNIELGSGDASAVSQTGTITNVAGAVFYVTSDGRIGTSGVGGGTLNNAGVVAVFAGAGETDIDAYVNDTGGIQAQSGVLGLNGGGTANAGELYVAANAVVQFGTMAATGTGGTFVFDGGPYVGTTVVNGSTVDLSAVSGVSFGAGLTVSSGTLLLGGNFPGAASFVQTGGEVSGTGYFYVASSAQLDGGLETGSGVTDLQGGGSIGGPVEFDGGRSLENDGTLTWTGGSITLGGGDSTTTNHTATLINTGVMQIETNGTINSAGFAGSGAISNSGTIMKAGGLGTTELYANLFNNGVVDVTSGTLALEQGVGGTGTFLLDGAATLDFVNGAASSNTMQFLQPGGTLETQALGMFASTISGFASGDSIDAAAVGFVTGTTTVGFSGGTLTVTDGVQSAAFMLSGNYALDGFHISSDGHGGTEVGYS